MVYVGRFQTPHRHTADNSRLIICIFNDAKSIIQVIIVESQQKDYV
jgi:hypothetical protein